MGNYLDNPVAFHRVGLLFNRMAKKTNIFVNGTPLGSGYGEGNGYDEGEDRQTYWFMTITKETGEMGIKVRASDLPKEYVITLKDQNERDDGISYILTVNLPAIWHTTSAGVELYETPTMTIRKTHCQGCPGTGHEIVPSFLYCKTCKQRSMKQP